MATWKQKLDEITVELEDRIIASTLTDDELNQHFDDGFGGSEGPHFTAWGEKYVFFPIVYDGAEWVGYAPRDPCDIRMGHQGGE